jgi:hypothetical protein
VLGALPLVCLAATSFAAEPDEAEDGDVLSKSDMRIYEKLSEPRGGYARVLLGLSAGRGFRFNNPYRLRTQLGDTAESASLTAPYLDGALGTTFGDPDGVQHGAVLHVSFALQGVSQQALSLSYLALYRARVPLMGYARLGTSLLTVPDTNVGAELAVGASYFVSGGLGINVEAVGNLFYGAGTSEAQYTVIPILSLQAGIMLDWEVLP